MAAPVKVEITGDAKSLFAALDQSTAGLKGFAKDVNAMSAGMSGMFKSLTAPIAAIAGLVGGGAFLKGTINETKDWAVEAGKLARTLGITTEQASVLNLAIGDIYGNMDEFLPVVAKLTKTLNSNEDAFKKLGVATRDNQGHLRPSLSIMTDVNSRLMEMKSGTDRNVASMQIYGRGWLEIQRYLGLTNEVMQSAQEKAERLNLIVGQDSVSATKAYRESMNELDDTIKALKIRMGQELMPVLTDFNNMAAEKGPDALGALGFALKGVIEIIDAVWSGFKMFSVGLVGLIRAIYQTLTTILNVAWGFLSGGIPGAVAAWKQGNGELTEDWRQTIAALDEIGVAYTQRQMTRWGELKAASKAAVAKPAASGHADTDSGRETPDEEAKIRKAIEAERMRHLQRMSAIETAEILRGQDERRKNNEWVLKEMEDQTKREEDQLRRDQEQAKNIIGYDWIAGMTQGLNEYLIKSQDEFQNWKNAVTDVIHGVQGAFASTFSGILSGQMTFAQGLRNLWQGITQAIVGALAQMAAQWITTQLMMAIMGKSSTASKVEGDIAGMTGSMSLFATETMAAYAMIPFYGPIIAAAQIAAGEAAMAPYFAAAAGAMAFAQGGVIDRPTLALMGEVPGSKEVVMPESTARQWLQNLTANVLGSQRQVQGYQRQSASYASAPRGSSGAGVAELNVHLPNAVLLNGSQRSLRQMGALVIDGARAKAREIGQVLVPGQVFGGI